MDTATPGIAMIELDRVFLPPLGMGLQQDLIDSRLMEFWIPVHQRPESAAISQTNFNRTITERRLARNKLVDHSRDTIGNL